jgi:ankyrin repeat protein
MKRKMLSAATLMGITLAALGTIPAQTPQTRPPAQAGEAISPLLKAVWKQDLARVKQLLAEGEDPGKNESSARRRNLGEEEAPPWVWAIRAGEDRATLLMLEKLKTVDRAEGLLLAAQRNDVKLARALLEREMPVDARAVNRATPLMIAASSGYVEMIKLLVERGANASIADEHGDTALMSAVRAGSLESIKLLLRAGADVNHQDKAGRTSLIWAARSGRVDVVKTLLADGAEINVTDNAGDTALTAAARQRQTAAVDMLRANHATGDATPLSASLLSPRAAVELSVPLIQRGAAIWRQRVSCGACHHAHMMVRAIGVVKRQGFPINEELVAAAGPRQASETENAPPAQDLKTEEGILRRSLGIFGDRAFAISSALSSQVEAGRMPNSNTEVQALFLAKIQLPDGSWRPCPPRVPIMSSRFTTTASAVRVLRHYGPASDAAEIAERIKRAAAWLRAATPVTTDDKVFRLFGLSWTDSDNTLIRNAADLLKNEQNADGGWAQLRGLNSDAYATGQVLAALHEAGGLRTGDPVYQRGIEFLLKRQEPDGSWLVHTRAAPRNEYFESGSPHGKFQEISYAGTCWAAMALAYASPQTSSSGSKGAKL